MNSKVEGKEKRILSVTYRHRDRQTYRHTDRQTLDEAGPRGAFAPKTKIIGIMYK